MGQSYFITGFPGFIGRRLVAHLAEQRRDAAIHLLVQPRQVDDAKQLVRRMVRPMRFEVLAGDVTDMHLGLSGAEYARLCDEVTDVFHLAAIYYANVPREVARRVNVEGTRNVLELARDCRALRRFAHFSTAFVSGDRVGVVAEDELDVGQRFRDEYEATKFQAEKLVARAMRDLPAVIFRPSIVVGDAKSGELDRFDGPYYLGLLLVTSPVATPLPLPGDAVAPMHLVPVDFVAHAAFALSESPKSTGKTFHLVDPSPMSARRIYEAVAERAGLKLPRGGVPARAAEALLRFPLLDRLGRPRTAVGGHLNQLVFYNCRNTLAGLEGTGIACPPTLAYLPRLAEFVRRYSSQRREETATVEDPLV